MQTKSTASFFIRIRFFPSRTKTKQNTTNKQFNKQRNLTRHTLFGKNAKMQKFAIIPKE